MSALWPNSAGETVARHLEHLTPADAGDDSATLLTAMAHATGSLVDRARRVALGTDELRPGQLVWDPAVAELWALPWTAQLTGATLPARDAGETDDAYLERARDAIINARGWRRGSPAAYKATARARLTGSRRVLLLERYEGSAWRVLVATYAGETPDPAQVEADLNDPEAALAGVRVVYRADAGWTLDDLEAAYAGQSIDDLEADFANLGALEANAPA